MSRPGTSSAPTDRPFTPPRRQGCGGRNDVPSGFRKLPAGIRHFHSPPHLRTAEPGVISPPCRSRSVAQPGSAPRSGRGGRRFKSSHSDQPTQGLGVSRASPPSGKNAPKRRVAPLQKRCALQESSRWGGTVRLPAPGPEMGLSGNGVLRPSPKPTSPFSPLLDANDHRAFLRRPRSSMPHDPRGRICAISSMQTAPSLLSSYTALIRLSPARRHEIAPARRLLPHPALRPVRPILHDRRAVPARRSRCRFPPRFRPSVTPPLPAARPPCARRSPRRDGCAGPGLRLRGRRASARP